MLLLVAKQTDILANVASWIVDTPNGWDAGDEHTHTITDTFKGKNSALRSRAFVCKMMHHSPSGAAGRMQSLHWRVLG